MHVVRVHAPPRRRVFCCGPEQAPDLPRTPSLPLSQLQAQVGALTRPTGFRDEENVHDWLVRTPLTPAWRTFLDSDHPVLRDDGVLPATVSGAVGRRVVPDGGSIRDLDSPEAVRALQQRMASTEWFKEHDPVSLHVHYNSPRHAGPLSWRPAWARLEGATPWDIGRWTAAALVLTAARTRSFTVEVPPSALHIQRWLDFFWSLNSLWRDDMPHLVLRIRGKISSSLQARLLLLFVDDDTHASVPRRTTVWPRIHSLALSRLHVQMHPTNVAEDLLGECDILANVVHTCTLASFSVHAGRTDTTSERRGSVSSPLRERDTEVRSAETEAALTSH